MTELVTIETLKPLQLFTENGIDQILEKIEREARSYLLDISTEKGRKEVASLAYKIAQSKTALDKMGKELVADWKEQAKKVDVERAKAWDRLEALQKEIRTPLTEWENREKERVANHEARLAEIENGGRDTLEHWQTLPVEAMRDRLKEIETDSSHAWEEFCVRAKHAIEQATTSIRLAIQKREQYDQEQAELERLRRAEAERQQREHEERLQAAAAAQARAEAEAKARIEAEKTERERQRMEREKAEAEARAEQAEDARLAAVAKAEADRKAAEDKAKRDAEAAVIAERDRIEAQQRAEAAAAAQREADKQHRTKINREALAALTSNGIAAEVGKLVIEAIARGQIPHIKIVY